MSQMSRKSLVKGFGKGVCIVAAAYAVAFAIIWAGMS